MELGLKGKTALVTGASKGLGRATAESFAREGMRVVISARTAPDLDRVAGEIHGRTGAEIAYFAGDLGDPATAEKLVRFTLEKFGPLHVVVGNAGGPPAMPFADTEDDGYRSALQRNLLGNIRLAEAAVPVMKRQKWGRLLHITSFGGRQPIPFMYYSNTARAAVHAFSKTLAYEVAPDGITVNCVCPGFILTDRLRGYIEMMSRQAGVSPKDYEAQMLKDVPAGRFGTPEEFADLMTFLASECAGFITGSLVTADGGMVRGL